MNAQEILINYAKANNNTSMTDQAWLGQAIKEGITKSRSGGSRIVVDIARSGKTITVTETTITPTLDGESRNSEVVLTVNL